MMLDAVVDVVTSGALGVAALSLVLILVEVLDGLLTRR